MDLLVLWPMDMNGWAASPSILSEFYYILVSSIKFYLLVKKEKKDSLYFRLSKKNKEKSLHLDIKKFVFLFFR